MAGIALDTALLALALVVLVALAWRDSMHARELAIKVCREACTSHDLQLLDDTVALSRIGIARGGGAGIRLRRVYEFELSDDGVSRLTGTLTLSGGQVEAIYLPVDSARARHDPRA